MQKIESKRVREISQAGNYLTETLDVGKASWPPGRF